MDPPSALPASAPHLPNIVATLQPKEFFIRPEVLSALLSILENPSLWSDPTYDAIGYDIMQMMILINEEKVTELTLDRIEYAYEHKDERLMRERREQMAFYSSVMNGNRDSDHWQCTQWNPGPRRNGQRLSILERHSFICLRSIQTLNFFFIFLRFLIITLIKKLKYYEL